MARNCLEGPVLLVDRASRKMTRRVACWAGCDPGCLLAAGRIKKSQTEQEPHRLLTVGEHQDALERPARSLVDQDGINPHRGSQGAVAS